LANYLILCPQAAEPELFSIGCERRHRVRIWTPIDKYLRQRDVELKLTDIERLFGRT
jgi:hypothetical protein